ncbi:MAG: thiol:disulfide interchange protein DsbA/DsbL [Burkholderiales bacterium]|nr:thiol:disulfide interchange protein DsbA/DsbL [Burkholderiales bacterium]
MPQRSSLARRSFVGACLALCLAVAGAPAAAQQFAAGADYTVLDPAIPTDNAGKVEVVEFFWYGCPHCYDLEPRLERWVEKLPKDVEFRRVPAPFNKQWAVAGRVYYTMESLGVVEKHHTALFDAIHKDGLRITNERAMTDWIGRRGVDAQKYSAAYRSFAVESKLKRAAQLTQASRIDGVPALMVNGKYVVSAQQGQTRERMLAIADHLIARSRQEMAKK